MALKVMRPHGPKRLNVLEQVVTARDSIAPTPTGQAVVAHSLIPKITIAVVISVVGALIILGQTFHLLVTW